MPTNTLTRALVAPVIAAALLSACGGGNSDDSAESKTSEACFNAGFYRAGSSIQAKYSTQMNGAAGAELTLIHRVSSVLEENGVHTIFVVPDSGRTNLQYSIQNGALLYQGSTSLGIGYGSRSTLLPAQQSVIAMEPGQITTQDIVQTDDYNTPDSSTRTISNIAYTRTYVGRATLPTSLGQFETCQFVERKRTTVVDSPQNNRDIETTNWVAANGAYRGLTLKSESVSRDSNATQSMISEIAQVTLFDIK